MWYHSIDYCKTMKNTLLILTALKAEASPIIKFYKLRQDENLNNLYCNVDYNVKLLITGVGFKNTQKSIEKYLSENKISYHNIIINIGSAGAKPDAGAIGELFYINKITDNKSEKTFFPDILYKHNMKENSLTTVQEPAVQGQFNSSGLFDMEASAIWQSFKSKIPAHKIIFLKIISDHLDIHHFDRLSFEKLITKLIENELLRITNFLDTLKTITLNDVPLIQKHENQILNKIIVNLRLTESQKIKLLQLSENNKYFNRNIGDLVFNYSNIKANDKHQRNKTFQEICELFST